MGRWFRDHGLLLTNLGLFVIFFGGMILTGVQAYNADQLDHGLPPVSLLGYLGTGDFGEATFENWESEFLQMCMYIVLTAYLVQRGSSESRPVGESIPQDADPRDADLSKDVPWPVRRGGWVLKVYENSLSLLFALLFLGSVVLHAVTGAASYSDDQLEHGLPGVNPIEYLATSQFWFESFQNWQSEFLAIGVMVWASVYLRQRRSPESKPVAQPNHETADA